MDMNDNFWHVELHCGGHQVYSNLCFLTFQMNNPNNRDNLPQIQHFLSPIKGIPQILTIFGPFPTYIIGFLVKQAEYPEYSGSDTNPTAISLIIQSIHYSYRHLLN